jgi:predicted nucleic acid-binding protein
VRRFIVDSSVALKWFVAEQGSNDALALRRCELLAPDLLIAECANALWKKVRRGELTPDEAILAADLLSSGDMLSSGDIKLAPMSPLMPQALRLSIALAHPAYDCFYLALAAETGAPFVSADDALARKLAALGQSTGTTSVLGLADAAASLNRS